MRKTAGRSVRADGQSFAARYVSDIADRMREAAVALQAAEGLFANGRAPEALEIMAGQIASVQEGLTLLRVCVTTMVNPCGPYHGR